MSNDIVMIMTVCVVASSFIASILAVITAAATIMLSGRSYAMRITELEATVHTQLTGGGLGMANQGNLRKMEIQQEKDEAISGLMDSIAGYMESWKQKNPEKAFNPGDHAGEIGSMVARTIATCPSLLRDISKLQRMVQGAFQ